jgi:hypothetical protein
MEYHLSFLAQWNPSIIAIAIEGISRDLVIDRYKSIVADTAKEPCFRDLSSVTPAVHKDTIAKPMQLYKRWGMGLHAERSRPRPLRREIGADVPRQIRHLDDLIN